MKHFRLKCFCFCSDSLCNDSKKTNKIMCPMVEIFFNLGRITPIDWDTGCAIFEGTFLAEK